MILYLMKYKGDFKETKGTALNDPYTRHIRALCTTTYYNQYMHHIGLSGSHRQQHRQNLRF